MEKSFDFKGRTSRLDFWYFLGIDFLIFGLICAIGGQFAVYTLFPFIVIGLLPRLAVVIRRLRDGGKSLFWIFSLLIPAIGTLILWYQLAQPSIRP